MRTMAMALLATSLISAPAIAASDNQQPQTNQMQPHDNSQRPAQPQGNAQQNQPNTQQQAQNNQPIAPNSLPRSEVRQVQQALDKDGFKAGRADGRWGPESANAMKQFQQSKQIQATGQLDQQTLADLGLDASRFHGSQK
jgi:Putative peptidoglycan binding domain